MKKVRNIILVMGFCFLTGIGISQNYPYLKLIGASENPGSISDNLAVTFIPDASWGFDNLYDAYKLPNTDPTIPNIYTKSSDEDWLSINAVPPLAYDVYVNIPLYYEVGVNGNYYIKLEKLENFSKSTSISLIDSKTSTTINLRTDTMYSFSATVGEAQRFSLEFFKKSPLKGTYTIKETDGDYPNFTDAINDLNYRGVDEGGVTFLADTDLITNENPPAITETGTATSPIIFQKSGTGANPIIIATGDDGLYNAGIEINGGDYITFDGIDINTTGSNLEYGYYILNASANNGSQYNTIKNCKIILNRTTGTSIGIYQFTKTNPSSTEGANSYNKYYNNTIENVYNGILLKGNKTFNDMECEIGGINGDITTIGADTPNDIGNGWLEVNGIKVINHNGIKIFNSVIQNLTAASNNQNLNYGIQLQDLNGTNEIYDNTIKDLVNLYDSYGMSRLSGIGILGSNAQQITLSNNNISLATLPLKAITAGVFINTTNNSNINFNKLTVEGFHNGLEILNGNLNIHQSTIKNNINGITLSNGTITKVDESYIINNTENGIFITGGMVTDSIFNNNISGNGKFGINNTTTTDIIARLNWWGDKTGPFHPVKNPAGLGDTVSDYVIFEPWLFAGITANGETSFCIGNSVVLTANTGPEFTYQWQKDGVDLTSETNINYTAAESGVYTVVVSNTIFSDTSDAITVTVNPLPIPTITGPETICEGSTDNIYRTEKDMSNYIWTVSAGGAIIGTPSDSVTVNWTVPGGTITVNYTNANGCTANTATELLVTVNPLPVATITPNGPTTFCEGGSVILEGNTGIGYTYQWWVEGTPIEGATDNNYNAIVGGTYSLQVFADGCYKVSESIVVTVNSFPVADITPLGPTTFCAGGSVALQATAGAGYTYQWYIGGTIIQDANGQTYPASNPGDYTVLITNMGCEQMSAPVTVTVVTVNAIVTNTDPTYVNQGQSVTLTAQVVPGATYLWFKNGTMIMDATNNTYTINNATSADEGNYYIIVALGICNQTSNSINVVVVAPDQCPAAVNLRTGAVTPSSVTILWDASIPNPVDAWIAVIAPVGTTDYRYRVTQNGVTSASWKNLLANTTYFYQVRAKCAGTKEGYSQKFFFTTSGTPCPYVSLINETDVRDTSAVVNWNASANATRYTIRYFDVNNRVDHLRKVGNVTSYTLLWLAPSTTYNWSVKVFCDNIGQSQYYHFNRTFTTLATGPKLTAPENINTMLSVYPNPSNGNFNVSVNNANNAKLSVVNIEGQEVYNKVVSGNISEEINLSYLAKGMYFVKLINENTTKVQKIVIQ